MSDIKHLDLDSEEFESAPRALRTYAEKLKKELAAATQQITEYRGREADQALGSVLAGFKSPTKVRRDLLADGVDPLDAEAVKVWVEENGDDYAKGSVTPAADPQQEAAPAAQNSYDAFSAVEQFAQPADMSKVQTAIAGITPDMTREQVAEHLTRMGL